MVSTYTVQFGLYIEIKQEEVVLSSLHFRCGSTNGIMWMEFKNSVIHVLTLSRFKSISTMLSKGIFSKQSYPLCANYKKDSLMKDIFKMYLLTSKTFIIRLLD